MFLVGLTGGIGSGKSVIARMFQVLGVPVFAADAEAKALMENDPVVRDQVIAHFGAEVYPNGELDRARLASVVFGNDEKVAALNAIVHPAVRKAFSVWAEKQTAPYVIMEAALMAENRLGSTVPGYDRSKSGEGILLRASNGTLVEASIRWNGSNYVWQFAEIPGA